MDQNRDLVTKNGYCLQALSLKLDIQHTVTDSISGMVGFLTNNHEMNLDFMRGILSKGNKGDLT